jgi:hypothetical protein
LHTIDQAPLALATRLESIDRELRRLRKGLPRHQMRLHRDMAVARLLKKDGDPWVKTALLEEALAWSSGIGEMPPVLLRASLFAPLVSASSPLWLAERARQSGDRALASRLCARALEIDPRRPCPY